jgi:putative glutamine amidotransferase
VKLVAISQRVDIFPQRGERRDALDQRWHTFLARCGYLGVPVPNHVDLALDIASRLPVSGLVLTGGNDLVRCGGDAPERDATEMALVEAVLKRSLPVMAICRGMQVIQAMHGVPLVSVQGHITEHHEVLIHGHRSLKNSYHRFGAVTTARELNVWARSSDGVVEGIRHVDRPIVGLMWHPERVLGFAQSDIDLFRETLR